MLQATITHSIEAEGINTNFPQLRTLRTAQTESILPVVQFLKESSVHNDRNQVKITYHLAHEWSAHFILTRGLLEFSRPRNLQFNYNTATRSITVNLESSQVANLKKLLVNVQQQLMDELHFRKKLKAVISFERQYRLQCQELYHTSTASS